MLLGLIVHAPTLLAGLASTKHATVCIGNITDSVKLGAPDAKSLTQCIDVLLTISKKQYARHSGGANSPGGLGRDAQLAKMLLLCKQETQDSEQGMQAARC